MPPKRDRAEYMRCYRAERKNDDAEPPPPAPELPDADPWRTMTAADALKWLLGWEAEQRLLANPEPDFWEVPYKQRAKVRKDWRREHQRCVNCGDPLQANIVDVFVTCDSCRENARDAASRRRRYYRGKWAWPWDGSPSTDNEERGPKDD